MEIFIDSAKLSEIEEASCCGFLDGVTTNPSLIKKAVLELKEKGENISMVDYITKLLETAKDARVSLEVTDYTCDGMVKQGKKLFKMFNPVANNVYVKIPVNSSFGEDKSRHYDGIRAIKTLSEEGIPINCTLIFTPEQALMAAKAGARMVSPFAGRIDDYIRTLNDIPFKKPDYFPAEGLHKDGQLLEDNGIVSGVDLVSQIVEIFTTYGIEAEVLAASIRNARQTREAALAGADIATVPLYVIRELVSHYKTREGMENFTKDVVPEYRELTEGEI